MIPVLRTLGVLSVLECLTVLALVTNLMTVHDDRVTSLVGPLHGALYLAVAATALLGRGLSVRTRIGALLPLLSGPLTAANVRRERSLHSPPRSATAVVGGL